MIYRLIYAFLLICVLAFSANATMVINPYSVVPAGPCSSTPVTYIGTQTSAADSTSYTFNGVSIGDPACAGNIRLVYVYMICSAISTTSVDTVTVAGVTASDVLANNATTRVAGVFARVNTGTTADIVASFSGGADNTCEAIALMVYVIITTTTVTVDAVNDVSATGDFDLSNVAVTSGGAEVVSMASIPASACGSLDATFNGTETVIEDVNATLDSVLTYTSGHFTADSTATVDDYANISCGTETAGMALAVSWEPPV